MTSLGGNYNRGPDVLNIPEQIITRFALVCRDYKSRGTLVLRAVQEYMSYCPRHVLPWLETVDMPTVNQIVRQALPHASSTEKVWREISRVYRGKTKAPINPAYL